MACSRCPPLHYCRRFPRSAQIIRGCGLVAPLSCHFTTAPFSPRIPSPDRGPGKAAQGTDGRLRPLFDRLPSMPPPCNQLPTVPHAFSLFHRLICLARALSLPSPRHLLAHCLLLSSITLTRVFRRQIARSDTLRLLPA